MILAWVTGAGLQRSLGLKHRSELRTTTWPASLLITAIMLLSNTPQAIQNTVENLGVQCFVDLGFWVLFLWYAFYLEVHVIEKLIVVDFLCFL